MLTVTRTSSEPASASALDLRDGGRDVGGVGVGHRLHDDRRAAADRDTADHDLPRAAAHGAGRSIVVTAARNRAMFARVCGATSTRLTAKRHADSGGISDRDVEWRRARKRLRRARGSCLQVNHHALAVLHLDPRRGVEREERASRLRRPLLQADDADDAAADAGTVAACVARAGSALDFTAGGAVPLTGGSADWERRRLGCGRRRRRGRRRGVRSGASPRQRRTREFVHGGDGDYRQECERNQPARPRVAPLGLVAEARPSAVPSA
mgnify:CR=1 FL=1